MEGRGRQRETEQREKNENYESGVKMKELKGFFAEEKREGVKGLKAISAVSLC